MKTQTKTEEQLITELAEMRQRIAELEKANTEHKQVEELFKSLTGSSPIGIYVVQDGKFQFVNAQFQKYADYSEDELLGMDSLSFVFPDDRNRVRENAVKMLKGERSIPYEYQFVNKEGEVRWIMETVVPIQYLGRRAALGNFMDITERKQAEEALRESEEKYRTVLEDIEDGYFEVGIAGNFTFFNDPLCGIIGYSRDEMMGMNNRQYMDKENAKKVYQAFNRVYTTGKPSKEFGWEITRKDGTKRFTEASVSLKRNSEGEPIGFRGIVRDITERKWAEEALRESEEKYRDLVDQMGEGYAVVRGNRIRFANRRYAEIVGVPVEKLIGESFWKFLVPEDLEQARQIGEMVTGGGKVTRLYEFVHLGEDGRRVPFEVSFREVIYEGEPSYAVVLMDITERKRAEEKIEHLNTVLRAIRNVNQLIAREKDSKRLIKDACVELVETSGYFNAWIALLDESGRLVTTAEAGLGKHFKPMVEVLKRGELTDCARKALKQSGVTITEDPLSTCTNCPLAHKYDGRGAITVRLEYDRKVYGLMSLSIPIDRAEVEEEQALFREVAGDIAFALHNIKLEEERRQVEEALQESQEKIRNLFESVTDGIFAIDLNGAYTEVNERMLEMHGFSSKDEILGENAFEFVAQRDIDRTAMVDMKRTLEQGSVASLEYTVVRTDGSEFPAEVNAKMLKDASGNPVGFIGSIRDITERKQAEEALRKSEEKYRALVDHMREGYMVVRGNRIRFANRRYAEVIGIPVEKLIGQNFWRFLAPESQEQARQTYETLTGGGKVPPIQEYVYLTEDGQRIPIEISIREVIYEGKPSYALVLRDITERKQAEEALRESEEKLRLIFESINDAVAVTDLEGNLVQVNEAAVRMTGYSNKEKLLGRNMLESIIAKKDRARIIEDMTKTLGEGHALGTRSYTLLAADGREFDAEFSTAVLRDSSGNVIRFIGVARDITERKRAEEELRKYREHLEELVEARTKELQDAQERLVRTEKLAVIGQLAGGVSHELRNPLGAIKNASYFLNMAIEQPEPEVKETLEILEQEVATSERIISSLLDFARPKTATLQNVHINEVIEESLGRVTVPENVEVVKRLDETLPIILADPGQLGQVFTNIILNAIQAMPEGGQLVLKSAVPSRGWAAVSFTDTGAGISEENLEKLFEPLFTTKAKGIGLGLAICRTMVETHGGTIEVQSTEGKGSTFTISLPVGKKEEH